MCSAIAERGGRGKLDTYSRLWTKCRDWDQLEPTGNAAERERERDGENLLQMQLD